MTYRWARVIHVFFNRTYGDVLPVFMINIDQLESYGGMSLIKIPFILLATWGINMSYSPPNPIPPQHERLPSSVLMENSGLPQWGTFFSRVSNTFGR